MRPLASGSVHYVGHPVAAVIARTRAQAEDAAEAIVIEISDRPTVMDPIAAAAPDAPLVWPAMPDNLCFETTRGDDAAVTDALAEAAHVTRARLRINRVTAVTLEPRTIIASHAADTGYRLDLGTQAPHRVAADLAPVLGETVDRIRVVSRDSGGSFGMKNTAYPEDALALWAARRTGQPVIWCAGRTESFLSDAHARDQYADVEIGFDADGRILGLRATITAGLGACLGPATPHSPVSNVAGMAGMYLTPAIHVTVRGVFTNAQQTAPYRGAGRPEATYIIERMLDIAAAEMGQDRVDLRRRNLIPPSAMPHKTPLGWIYDCGDFPGVMQAALKAADWAGFDARRKASARRGLLRGRGIANPVEIAGGPAHQPLPEYAAMSVAAQGNARIVLGSCSAGQGHETAFRQILHHHLGIDPEAIEVVSGDTGIVPMGTGTFGSRTLMAAGTALRRMIDDVIADLRPTAAAMLDCAPDALRFQFARFIAPSGRSAHFLEVAAQVPDGVAAEMHVAPDAPTYPNGVHVCEVDVDPQTGQVGIDRYTVVDDVGTVINPMLVKGQILGGVVQGIGQALMEDIVLDADSGQILTASFMDYAMPRAADIPMVDVRSYPVPTATNPLGAKGAGEAGTVGALAACMNAVCDALAGQGIVQLDMPATPQRVWNALQRS